ncbi:MAG: type II toxin-antitoxin system Phd/YefM family antitoxin [Reyranella sp.]|uniref:type II toxin-antitoxin system Phd/YefM family antitoxin n=1 Tax=Reyranella sp. TaxID=1929291 RepID=UPI001ACCFF38|nr:type II toxin-antitoxin system Phd/YefM family antitoxin [Reyranella sp.]MBN9090392.1 type II toxin-antitoxin system Phd/YefM family antitoxin [Reyranella sp.]
MKSWAVQDAKARFSEMLEACLRQGPQLVTKRGSEAAILVPIDDWRRLTGAPVKTLKDLLLTDEARGDLKLPARGRHPRRPMLPFD